MSMSDPIADMIVRIKNAHAAKKNNVRMPSSKQKISIANLLKEEGYILDLSIDGNLKPELVIYLKYYENIPVISRIDRVSTPGLRRYVGKRKIPKVDGGLGISIISTSHGLMTGRKASQLGYGGEIICYVS